MARFFRVASKRDLEAPRCVDIEGKRIALFNVGDQVYAIDDICTHEGGPLSEGLVDGDEVECPWHAARFNIATGEACGAPAYENVARYNVRLNGDDIEVQV